ncbi:MAG: hypothetical protein DRJ32_01340 [Thermoprotei archaeon]|nr:MAG: hypothetical protein DRJ32_01340 [Thermoprotei archaeon]HDD64094.1 hypothetical protein [Thermoprotei archaeon]
MSRNEGINLIPVVLITVVPILIVLIFYLTDNFHKSPSIKEAPLISLIIGIISIILSLLSYKISRDESEMSYEHETVYKVLSAISLGLMVLGVMFTLLIILFYFLSAPL